MSSKLLAVAAGLLWVSVAAAQGGPIELREAWARASPGGAQNGAAYLTIVAPAGDRLVAVATPAAAKAELHTMAMENGVMKMRPLAALDLPAGQAVTLKPGGVHIMLLDLQQPLREGATLPLTLTFDKAGPREVIAAIAKPGAAGPHSAHGSHGDSTPAHR